MTKINRTKVGATYTASGYGRGVNKRNVYLINNKHYAYHPAYAKQAFTPLEGELFGYVAVNKLANTGDDYFYACGIEEHKEVIK